MKQYSDFKAERSGGGREILPAGGYVCQIMSAKVESSEWGDTLIIAHDVCEGEFSGLFKRDYDNNTMETRKWRGTFRIKVPMDDGTDYDVSKKKWFNHFIWAIEQSNPGYAWAWDEKTLKGKKVGLIYRNKEWEMGDRRGWTTEAAGSDSIDNIRNGKFKMLKDKALPVKESASVFTEEADDGLLPF